MDLQAAIAQITLGLPVRFVTGELLESPKFNPSRVELEKAPVGAELNVRNGRMLDSFKKGLDKRWYATQDQTGMAPPKGLSTADIVSRYARSPMELVTKPGTSTTRIPSRIAMQGGMKDIMGQCGDEMNKLWQNLQALKYIAGRMK